ncbi:hypothetical protein KAJ89_04445 [Candidatus Parcubacteria bacterium]|nr:hypothetical protein [Candidatus Parcubacteria bacterium]
MTNLILHTTSLISRKKKQLLISHASVSIVNIIVIIVLEIFLVIISIPLYTIYGNLHGNNKIRHWAVRIVFLTILIIFLIIGMAKLLDFKL